MAVFDVTELDKRDDIFELKKEHCLIDGLLEQASNPVVLLNKQDLLASG